MFYSVPDVHSADRAIPKGKVLLSDTGLPEGEAFATREVLETGTSRQMGTAVTLEACGAGWTNAGSTLRWDNGCFRVATIFNGSRHSRAYGDYMAARDLFDKWTGEAA